MTGLLVAGTDISDLSLGIVRLPEKETNPAAARSQPIPSSLFDMQDEEEAAANCPTYVLNFFLCGLC